MAVSRALILSVLLLDVIAFGLALGAESRRHHVTVTEANGYLRCKYAKDAATGLGITAFVFLLLSQILITVLTRCLCCSSPLRPGGARIFAIIFFVLSWFTFVIAEICLLSGSTRAAYRIERDRARQWDCRTLRRGIFSAAAAFTFFTLLLTEGYYYCFTRAQEKNWNNLYGPGGPGVPPPYNSAGSYNSGGGRPYSANPEAGIGMTAYPAHNY